MWPLAYARALAGRPLSEPELAALTAAFEATIAEDTVLHHAVVHAWLLDAARARSGADAFAPRIYAELFRTPASNAWLGLVPPAVFSGILDDGIVAP